MPVTRLYDIPLRYDIIGGELFQHYPGDRTDIKGIDLHEVSRAYRHILLWLPYRIGPLYPSLCRNRSSARFHDIPSFPQILQDTSHGRYRNTPALGSKKRTEFLFAPSRILPTQGLHCHDEFMGPGGVPQSPGTAGRSLREDRPLGPNLCTHRYSVALLIPKVSHTRPASFVCRQSLIDLSRSSSFCDRSGYVRLAR